MDEGHVSPVPIPLPVGSQIPRVQATVRDGETQMPREQRRLAAIVSADVAGYSRLMGRDESGTLAALKGR